MQPPNSTQTAVVIGVGPGLGAALVDTLAAEGYTVFAAARHIGRVDALTTARPRGRVIAVDCDATVAADVDALFARAASEGPIAMAVFNAGTFQRGSVLDTSPEDFERCWRVGCFGGFLVGRAAARAMVPNGAGTIVLTGATASLRGGAGFVNLAAPKFGLRALAQSMARELGPKGIHVAHAVIDGQIRSPRYEAEISKRGPDSLLEPSAIAQTYLALHRQPRTAWTHELDLRPWSEKF